MNQICPLCQSLNIIKYLQDEKRSYLKCPDCLFVFVPTSDHVSIECEKKRYDKHINTEENEGYVDQFKRLIDYISDSFSKKSKGLDFGSGSNPVLVNILNKKGYDVDTFDIFYANDENVFDKKYDFITATEVVEHLADPIKEIKRLIDCLQLGGKLLILTHRYPAKEEFLNWYYKNDCTHISYFSEKVFYRLAEILFVEVEIIDDTLVVFTKK